MAKRPTIQTGSTGFGRVDDFRRPGDVRPTFQNQDVTGRRLAAQARCQIREEEEEKTGVYSFDPQATKDYRDRELDRVGRPGGSTMTKKQIDGC